MSFFSQKFHGALISNSDDSFIYTQPTHHIMETAATPISNELNTQPKVTLILGPRERFSYTRECLESIYNNTDYPFELVFVDVRSPKPIEDYINQKAREKSFKVIRTDRYISPNQARNVGLRYIFGKTGIKPDHKYADNNYIVFVENDVVVKRGWLTKLVACAEETGAAVVGPLTCIGHPAHQVIHNAGGRSYIKTDTKYGKPRRRIKQSAYLTGRAIADVPEQLHRTQCDYVEFHCMLVKTELFFTDVFKKTDGLLDEGMMATREHIDFCFMASAAGSTIYSEREAVVTTDTVGIETNKEGLKAWFGKIDMPDFEPYDLPYFMLRWSDNWDRASLHHLRDKWNLTEDKYFHRRYARLGGRRHELLIKPLVDKITLGKGSDRLEKGLIFLERKLNQYVHQRYTQRYKKLPSAPQLTVIQQA